VTAFALRRLALAALVALLVSAAAFGLIFVAGDPAIALAGQSGRAQDAEYLRVFYGLDRPWIVQYADWTWRALRGDFGRSLYFNLPVGEILWQRVPVTLTLGCAALLFGLALAVPLGIVAAMRPDTWIDRGALFLAVVGQAIPGFWLGLILIIVFGMRLGWVPISGTEEWRGYILPTVVLGTYVMPSLMRILRTGMIEVLATDYIRAARAKGLLAPRILLVHALRNAALPLVSLAAVQFGVLLSGSIVIESVFALNGVGRLAWESILRSDLPVVQAIVLVFSLSYVALTLAADLVNAWLDPRLRA
jgi:peptide/nickel transport system permease protein